MKKLSFYGIPFLNESMESHYDIIPCTESSDEGYYFVSNDVLKFKKPFFQWTQDSTILGIANTHFIHFIAEAIRFNVNIKRIIATDVNISQLRHFLVICNYIINSNDRIDFLELLFKVRFNKLARELLHNFSYSKKGYVHGGIRKDNHIQVERKIWENLSFFQNEFESSYSLKVESHALGLKITTTTIGDFDNYFATILCGSKEDYPFWPFTIAYGSGFLSDENSFNKVRDVLKKTPLYLIKDDISHIYKDILYSNKYTHVLFWSSNLLCDYFVQKHRPLKKIYELSCQLGTQREPFYPEIDLTLFQDARSRKRLPLRISNHFLRKRPLSVHTESFFRVSHYITGSKNLEIVNVGRWIEQDAGESKLPNTEIMHLNDFLLLSDDYRYSSIFLHILVGHGATMSTFSNTFKKAFRMTNNLLVLEHNSESKDFRKNGIGLSIKQIRNAVGIETHLVFCPGKGSNNRNILCVFRR